MKLILALIFSMIVLLTNAGDPKKPDKGMPEPKKEVKEKPPKEKPPKEKPPKEKPPKEKPPKEKPPKEVVSSGNEMGTVNIASRPSAKLLIDGRDTGRFTPVLGLKVKEGRHRITLIHAGLGIKKTFSISVKPNQQNSFSFKLQ